MSLKEFLTSRIFMKHLVAAVVFAVVIVFLTMQALKIYTHHGESYPVPDFSGITEQEALAMAQNMNVMVEIVDSVYSNDAPPGVVVDQFPTAGSRVKAKRIVSLIINSKMPEQVALPQLTNISVRQATVWAENSGLKVGQITYEQSEYNDLVLKVTAGHDEIFPGDMLNKGDSINLVIGRMYGTSEVPLPDLKGLTQDEAQEQLVRYMLTMGVVVYDNSVITGQDSLSAQIWRQSPSPDITRSIYTGSSVDIWVSVDSSRFQLEEEQFLIEF